MKVFRVKGLRLHSKHNCRSSASCGLAEATVKITPHYPSATYNPMYKKCDLQYAKVTNTTSHMEEPLWQCMVN